MIDLIKLCKEYKNGKDTITALNNVSLSISKGEIFGIIGLSGAGKSTLLRCINRLEEPTSGKVLVDGIDITELRGIQLRKMRKRMGMVFQHFNLLMNSTVFENIAFPLKLSGESKAAIEKRTAELLEVVELTDKKDSYPSQLSGGQKQRAGIARALAGSPDIILSDEATSALDPATTGAILKLLKEINKEFGITMVIVTHEMSVIKQLCSRAAVIENSAVVEQGKVAELFSNPETQTSKRFFKDMTAALPEGILLKDDCQNDELLRLSFLGETAGKPFISRIIREYGITANIVAGNIESIQGMQIGSLIVKISGESCSKAAAIRYLSENKVKCEVLKNGSV